MVSLWPLVRVPRGRCRENELLAIDSHPAKERRVSCECARFREHVEYFWLTETTTWDTNWLRLGRSPPMMAGDSNLNLSDEWGRWCANGSLVVPRGRRRGGDRVKQRPERSCRTESGAGSSVQSEQMTRRSIDQAKNHVPSRSDAVRG